MDPEATRPGQRFLYVVSLYDWTLRCQEAGRAKNDCFKFVRIIQAAPIATQRAHVIMLRQLI